MVSSPQPGSPACAECDRAGALLVPTRSPASADRYGPRRHGVRPTSPRSARSSAGPLIGAVGGRREIMETLAARPVFHAGTLPATVATAAGRAAGELTADVYPELTPVARLSALGDACWPPGSLRSSRWSARWSGCARRWGPAGRLRWCQDHHERVYATFFHALLDAGVALASVPTRRCSSDSPTTMLRARRDADAVHRAAANRRHRRSCRALPAAVGRSLLPVGRVPGQPGRGLRLPAREEVGALRRHDGTIRRPAQAVVLPQS